MHLKRHNANNTESNNTKEEHTTVCPFVFWKYNTVSTYNLMRSTIWCNNVVWIESRTSLIPINVHRARDTHGGLLSRIPAIGSRTALARHFIRLAAPSRPSNDRIGIIQKRTRRTGTGGRRASHPNCRTQTDRPRHQCATVLVNPARFYFLCFNPVRVSVRFCVF